MENKGLFQSPGNKFLLEKWGVSSARSQSWPPRAVIYKGGRR